MITHDVMRINCESYLCWHILTNQRVPCSFVMLNDFDIAVLN